jgi:hypothetical protein
MIIGDKQKFAIDFKIYAPIDAFFIGDGYFLVCIDGFEYGIKKSNATVFGSIEWDLKTEFMNHINDENLELCGFSSQNICEVYYDKHYREINDFSIDDYEAISNALENSPNSIKEWSPETAFDDGSFVMQCNKKNEICLLGFKAYGYEKIKDIHSVCISKEYYTDILNTFFSELDKFRRKHGL